MPRPIRFRRRVSATVTRRDALKGAALLGAGVWLGTSAQAAEGPNDKLNVAVVGLGGQGRSNLNGTSSQNIVALCDVDDVRAGDAYTRFPGAKKFTDFRVMCDEMEKQIDAVVVSTPDHTHFHPSYWALERGKHLYCEKPLAHNVWEVRTLTELAREKKLATQLGAQRHTMSGLRQSVELIMSGAIGTVYECHAWVGGSRGMPKIPTDSPKVPSTVQWDLWRGPAIDDRGYHPDYVPYGWRFWWDYGTGETGNWGCHILDIPFWALGLTQPTKVSAEGPEVHPELTPKSMHCTFEFPAVDSRPAVKLHWYHGTPPILAERGLNGGGMNNLFLGSKGMLLCGFDKWTLLPAEKYADYKAPAPRFAKSPGFHREWIDACRGGEAATCNFDYSGPMTETVLLGNVAYRAGGFEWDHAGLVTTGNTAAQELIREAYRPGWEIG